MAARQQTMLMMTLRRTLVLPPGRGLIRPSRAGIGASSAAGAAVSAVGAGHGGGRRSVVAQTVFCQLPHFCAVLCRNVAPLVEADWWLLIAHTLPPVRARVSLAGGWPVRV